MLSISIVKSDWVGSLHLFVLDQSTWADIKELNIINTKKFDRGELKDLFLSKKIYRVNSKIIISDEHLKQLVEIVGFMPGKFSVKDFKDKSNLSRKYAIPYLELLDKIGVTQKIDKAGSRKKL